MLFDTHCHLTHERYRDDLPDVLARAHAVGVIGIVAIASDLEDAARIRGMVGVEASSRLLVPAVWGTAGIHPHEAARAPRELRSELSEALDFPGVVAVGECGLDFHYDHAPRPIQRRVFDLQIEVAAERGLPLVVHCREAEAEMADRIREASDRGVRGVLHCFPGDLELLALAMDAGWFVSFTGLVTFRNFGGVEAVRSVPADRYMLETDGPYMAPVPHRGERNESAFVPRIRDRIAELRGEAPSKVESDTARTARRFFGLPEPLGRGDPGE